MNWALVVTAARSAGHGLGIVPFAGKGERPKRGAFGEAKKIVCPFDLPHEIYHVCINDCYIFREGDADKTTCPVCKAARYKKGRNKAP